MNVLIVDDEPLARTRLSRLLEQLTDVDVVAEAQNGEQAIVCYEKHKPDIILMDIRMPGMDGLVAAKKIASCDEPPAVIFCTAFDDYALDAFEANAVDYLLKPVNRDKLIDALGKARRLNRVQLSALTDVAGSGNNGFKNNSFKNNGSTINTTAAHTQRSHICAKSSRGMELVPLDDVRYFLADQKYVTVFHVADGSVGEILIDESLKDLEQEFNSRFVRVHRNALVAKAYIQGLERTEDGARVKLAGLSQGPQVSRRHMPAIRKMLQSL